ncbi:Tensin-2 [Manis pentadactyla]|nr:Tensin-2 [Manis pentadactyla]
MGQKRGIGSACMPRRWKVNTNLITERLNADAAPFEHQAAEKHHCSGMPEALSGTVTGLKPPGEICGRPG